MFIVYFDEVKFVPAKSFGSRPSTKDNVETVRKYWAIDFNSGGYPYWSNSIKDAKIFPTFDQAHDLIRGTDFTCRSTMTDGMSYPARMLHDALGLCNTKKTGTVTVCVGELTVTNLDNVSYTASIQDETASLKASAKAKLEKAGLTAAELAAMGVK